MSRSSACNLTSFALLPFPCPCVTSSRSILLPVVSSHDMSALAIPDLVCLHWFSPCSRDTLALIAKVEKYAELNADPANPERLAVRRRLPSSGRVGRAAASHVQSLIGCYGQQLVPLFCCHSWSRS